ncbi:hypothetical protein ACFQPG_00160 [Sphingomonas sp. GCM10030256]|uniref:hypothetical protein n=1 Tax=Sphingomonas sp. GCM10030256 TaxID=3273427 RepID=UPI00360CE5EF
MKWVHILLAAVAMGATPAAALAAAPAKRSPATAARKTPTKPDLDPAQAMAVMTKFLDRLFPAGPEPEPMRLAAARGVTMLMFPKGAYAEAMNGFIERTADQVLGMTEADFAELMPSGAAKGKSKAGAAPSRVPLGQALAAKDPQFDAKLAAGKAFAKTMFVKLGDVAEPKFREGMARSLARKFDARQLGEINGFLATPTGAAYGRQMVGLWFEPDVLRGAMQSFPEMMKMMPELGKDAAGLGAQMKAQAPDKK